MNFYRNYLGKIGVKVSGTELSSEPGGERRASQFPDRFLMRLKDVIIIGTAGFALIKWFVVNPIKMQDQVTRQDAIQIQQQKTLEKIATAVEVQTAQLGNIEKRFIEFQRSFYAKKPGGWVYNEDRWKWSEDNTK